MRALLPVAATLCLTAFIGAGNAVAAQDAEAAARAFAENCFSPYLTAQKAQETLGATGARVSFYDLRPFSAVAPSPVTGRSATAGTDRRCEVSFDGDHRTLAVKWLNVGLEREGLAEQLAPVPHDFPAQAGAVLIAAAQLNPNRIAVVQAGVRPHQGGTETFMNVERLLPLNETKQ